MSRIGKLPIPIPAKVKVSFDAQNVTVEGPKGRLTKGFHPLVEIRQEENSLVVEPRSEVRIARAMYGTTRSILANMVQGVVEGYQKRLEINGVGFRADVEGKILHLALGYSHPIKYPIPEGITINIDSGTKVTVEGPDKHMVGQVAADIKHFYPVEPYKGKGVRIEGEYVRRKEGKKAG